MSRDQISVPLKSKALSMPVPVITHTVVPSVTGDGVDMFCFCSLTFPPPSGLFQIGSPFRRSTAHNSRLPDHIAVATLRKMWSPQMIGVAPLRLGSGIFHAMFSVVDHFVGRPFSMLMPLASGPRQVGQFSAAERVATNARQPTPRKARNRFNTALLQGV